MERKVNKVGQGTLTISLPAKYAKQRSIRAGDTLHITEGHDNLIISTKPKTAERTATITFSINDLSYTSPWLIKSYLGRFYRNGYSKIIARYDSSAILAKIRKAVNDMYGADIKDHDNKHCTIIIFPHEDNIDYKHEIARIHLTLKELFSALEEELATNTNHKEHISELRNSLYYKRDYMLRRAALERMDHAQFSSLAHHTHTLHKITAKLWLYYKRAKPNKSQTIKRIKHILNKITRALRKEEITYLEEAHIREEIHDAIEWSRTLRTKNADHTHLDFIYFTLEMLDNSIPALVEFIRTQTYKKANQR